MNKSVSFVSPCRQALNWRASVRRLQSIALLAGSSLLAVGTLQANTEDDVASGLAAGTANLSAASSYSTTAPSTGGVPTATTDIVFTAGGDYSIGTFNIGSALSAGSLNDLNTTTAIIIQNGNGSTQAPFTLNGGDSISGNTADLLYVATGATLTINKTNTQDIVLGASGNFDVAGTATVNAAITGTPTAANSTTYNTSAFALTKTGAGTLTLGSTANSFTGGFTVSAGTLTLSAGGGASTVKGVLTVGAGTTLNLSAGNALGYTAGAQVTTLNINGGTVNTTSALGDEGYLTSFSLTGGTLAYTGTNATNGYQIAAADATAPSITSNASATSSLISGNVNIRSGTLPINVAAGTTTTGVDLQISGVISAGTTAYAVAKNGAGNLVLSNFNTYNGGTTVNGGTLTLNKGGLNGTVLGVVSLATGTTLNLAAVDALGYNSTTVVVSMINANGATISNTSGGNEGFLTSFNLTGATVTSTAPTGGTAGTYVFNTTATAPPTITSNASATTSTISAPMYLQNAGSLGIGVAQGTTTTGTDLLISGIVTGAGGFTKTGAGYLNLTGASTFTGNVAINAGTVNIGAVGADGGVSSVLGATNGKTITVASGATLSETANNGFGRGATSSALPTITLNGGTLSTTRYTALGALNLNGATMTSNDTVDIGAYQTYQLRGNVTVGGTAGSTISATSTSATTGGVHLDTASTFTVNTTGATGADLTVSAPFRDRSGDYQSTAGGLTKAGAGTMLLTATNTYTGPTVVNAGALFVSGSTATGSMVTVSGTGTVLGGAGNGTSTGVIGGPVTVGSGAILTAGNKALATPATGVLTTGALTLQTGSTFNALLASNSSFSTLNAVGTTDLINAAFSVSLTSGAAFTNNSVLQLITSNVVDTFTNTTYTAGGYTFTADYGTNPGFFDVDVAMTAVPEPSTWVAGVMMVGLLGGSRRRQLNGWLRLARG